MAHIMRILRGVVFVLPLVWLAHPVLRAQPAAMDRTLSNADIIAMSARHDAETAIVRVIGAANDVRFDVGRRARARLVRAGVSAPIIREMERAVRQRQLSHDLLGRARAAALVNESTLPTDQIEAALRRWHRFDLTRDRSAADVLIHRRADNSLAVTHRGTGRILWSVRSAVFADQLKRLQQDIPERTPRICVAVWCW